MKITSTINPADFDKLKHTLASISKTLDPVDRRKVFIEASDPIIQAMKARTPVDTGRLRDSIGVDPKKGIEKGEAYVGVISIRKTKKNRLSNPAVYGKFIEYGNRRQRAQPFVRPGFDGTKNKAISIIANLFERLIKSKLQR